MDEVRAVLALLVLGAWAGLWWLAVRIVLGTAGGVSVCAAVVVLAYVVPLMVSDLIAVQFRASEFPFLAAWGGVAVVIDGAWAARRVRRWYRARSDPKPAEPGAAPDTAG